MASEEGEDAALDGHSKEVFGVEDKDECFAKDEEADWKLSA